MLATVTTLWHLPLAAPVQPQYQQRQQQKDDRTNGAGEDAPHLDAIEDDRIDVQAAATREGIKMFKNNLLYIGPNWTMIGKDSCVCTLFSVCLLVCLVYDALKLFDIRNSFNRHAESISKKTSKLSIQNHTYYFREYDSMHAGVI